MLAARLAARRLELKRNRIEQARARFDNRAWVVTRRTRTRKLIELGGLVAKAGLAELAERDSVLLYGAFHDLAARLQGEDGDAVRRQWKRIGTRGLVEPADKSVAPKWPAP